MLSSSRELVRQAKMDIRWRVVGEAVVGATNGVITSITNTSSCTEAGDSATWITTFTEDNLNSLRTNNMRASFQASITNDAGDTLRATPQALFVVPNIAPRGNSNNNFFESVFSDIYKIGETCRIVNVINVQPTGSFALIWVVTTKGSGVNLQKLIFSNRKFKVLPISDDYTTDVFHNPKSTSSTRALFTSTLSFVVPNDKSTYQFRAFSTTGGRNINLPQTYHHCGVGPVPSN